MSFLTLLGHQQLNLVASDIRTDVVIQQQLWHPKEFQPDFHVMCCTVGVGELSHEVMKWKCWLVELVFMMQEVFNPLNTPKMRN